ncbi:Vacuolar calcium ion transporter 2 [Colletotrichum plurivorum]|uniref:Vacuolar calcium ion transporter 2 n=1 Tax=Colletotrichum plurivorum TaxID=2175906 RepID=A0A8H6KA51_9PEZI|nr:Vacuolar calcium ion transporter 2 [Colletotrichum plurivorum]
MAVLGSVLSNLLLVMGMCFLFGGIVNMRDRNGQGREQNFASMTFQTTRPLMTLSSASLVLPTTVYSILDKAQSTEREHTILILSRGTAIVLLSLYYHYLWFQLKTHTNLFITEILDEEYEGEDDKPIINLPAAVSLLVVVIYFIALCAISLIGRMEDVVQETRVGRGFIGLIIVPNVSNSAEHIAAVRRAVNDKMDLAIGIAIGSSIQTVLFISPLLVILGWTVLDKPMTFHFEMSAVVVFVFTVPITYALQDGRSNYLQGNLLLGFYAIIVFTYLVSPRVGQGLADSFVPTSPLRGGERLFVVQTVLCRAGKLASSLLVATKSKVLGR